tara:strand:- start:49 stop:195 length:147 start_codon:yes stop_codon:yes gene_type:complete
MVFEPLIYIAFYDLLATLLATYWLVVDNNTKMGGVWVVDHGADKAWET